MNEYQEETHYQVALTNRQVLTAFVVLLVCLFVAFFAGVWIGEEDSSAAADGVIVQPDDPSDETFRFFGESATEEPTERASQPASDEGDEAPPPQVMKPRRESAEAALREPIRPVDRSGDRSSESVPPPSEPAPARPEPPQPQAAAGESPSGILAQVFSSSDQKQAQDLAARLQADGYPAFLVEAQVSGRPHYRVRVGPFASRSEAEEKADEIERKFRLDDSWIVTEP